MSLFLYEQETQTVNLSKVKYLTMTKISELFIKKGAIIFGGFVRDKLIHDHYASAYYNEHEGEDIKYSDPNHSPETKHRLLVPKDIDLFIRGTEEHVEEIYSFIRSNGFMIEIKIQRKIYGAFDNINQQKIVIRTVNQFGFPPILIDVDVLFSSDDKVKPPFKRLDLWCNSLLMDNTGITFSDQTGSRIDDWNLFDRKLFEIGLLEKLLKFETCEVELMKEGADEQIVKNKKMISNRIDLMKKRGWVVTHNT